ncbi:MAG: hypothetical protein AAF720_12605 [Pseudomonadota bacterium]
MYDLSQIRVAVQTVCSTQLSAQTHVWTALSIAIAVVLFPLWAAFAQTPEQRAEDIVDSTKSHWDSYEAVEKNLSAPLNDAATFSTFDDATTFAEPIACLSSDAFLEVFFAPGAGGDLAPVIARQDTDFDGVFDVNQTLPAAVSGVCANGVISCTPGTWSGCQGNKWVADPSSSVLGLSPTPIDELGGCYCVNDSCGTNLAFLNEHTILSDLSGGMAGALMQVDPRYAVSTVGRAPFQITLSGQSTTACRTPPALTQTAYESDPAKMAIDATSAASTDPLFAKIKSLPAGASTSTTDVSCEIEKLAVVDDDVASIVQVSGSGEYSIDIINANEMVLTLGREGNNYLSGSCNTGYIDNYKIQVTNPAALVSVVLENGRVDDDLQLHRDGATLVFARRSNFTNYTGGRPGKCGGNKNDKFTVNQDLTAIFSAGAPHDFRLRTVVSGKGERFLKIRFRTTCAVNRSIVDTCATFASDSGCNLHQEQVDGVTTYLNGAATGLTPLPSTRTLGSGACIIDVTEPWWRRDRTYRCTATGTGSDLPVPDLDRVTYIYENSTNATWSDRYTDSAGAVITSSGSLNPPEPVVIDECEMVCKTTRAYQNRHVTLTGTAGDLQTDRTDVEFAFHACSAGVCPAGPGETVVTPCGCVDSFPEAMVMMQAVRLGARDLICTTGTPQPF